MEPVHEALHRRLVERQVFHADETTPQSKSHMWLYRTSGGAGHPILEEDITDREPSVAGRDLREGAT